MTRKGVWNLQQVRDKYLQSLWVNTGQFFSWGDNGYGQLGQNNDTSYSSPVQLSGDWSGSSVFHPGDTTQASVSVIKGDGTLWTWGANGYGQLAQNNKTSYSSPIQVGSDTTWAHSTESQFILRTKTDGTLWSTGRNWVGQLGLNDKAERSSPTQIGSGTDWDSSTKYKISTAEASANAIKTDGTLWTWGWNENGVLGLNQAGPTQYSSPVQVPGTTWTHVSGSRGSYTTAIKTDGTLWVWGRNNYGHLGLNSNVDRSSPTQIPGTWSHIHAGQYTWIGTKTDGTLWSCGYNNIGQLGLNDTTNRSSPTQIPGTTWNLAVKSEQITIATKTDGTLWAFGRGGYGSTGQNNRVALSSPAQIPGVWQSEIGITDSGVFGVSNLLTPSQL